MSRHRAFAFVALLGAFLAKEAVGDRPPRLAFDVGVPGDLQALAETTWSRFLAAFPARRTCIPDVALVGTRTLPDRAEYRPATSTILVRIPATAGQLEAALVHELAHHLEFHCPEHVALRARFLRAQGMPGDHPWFAGDSWETTPSEQFAEATVEAVLGDRVLRRRLPIADAAVALIRAWGRDAGTSSVPEDRPAPAPTPTASIRMEDA